MSSTLMRPSAAENMRSASLSAGRTTRLISGVPGKGGSAASSAALAARKISSAVMSPRLARQLVAAARAADALEDAVVDQRLQHRFEMTRRQLVARGQRLGRDRAIAGH